ncbi:MAG: hypothetical protein HY784_17105, partial [Chloroflexi bacterium]|nr:hypothetical protein [Chloroflexota bacterium]
MTGTALTEAEEFSKIYQLDVAPIPPNLEYVANQPESGLTEVEFREDGHAERFYFFARKEQPDVPVFWRRKDYADMVFRTEEAKLRAIGVEILSRHAMGQPMLVGTTSVENSEQISGRLRPESLRRLAQTLLIRDAWFESNQREEDGRLVEELLPLNRPLDELNPGGLRQLAKDVGLSFNPEDPDNVERLAHIFNLPVAENEHGQQARTRLLEALRGGVRHEVLNAKKHDEESQIITGAGALGAVTIATNMAGRGVDIKLGGELAEEILTAVNRVIRRTDGLDPYDMTMEERLAALERATPEYIGIYDAEVSFFRQHMADAARVREVCGLHVIGTERHEARRIDNQLRGRAARQGDPGSSQFYLSLEDELMRRFGGSQVSDLMQRLKIDDTIPIAHGIVNKTIEQSQTRVEGANFDVRKHLLEYDDVLNTQRNKIYEQRDRIFTKERLDDDILPMLEAEIARRVGPALADEEGPWKLLAWLEEIQPTIVLGEDRFYPSYMLRLLLEELEDVESHPAVREGVLKIARQALDTERERLLRAVNEQLD